MDTIPIRLYGDLPKEDGNYWVSMDDADGGGFYDYFVVNLGLMPTGKNALISFFLNCQSYYIDDAALKGIVFVQKVEDPSHEALTAAEKIIGDIIH